MAWKLVGLSILPLIVAEGKYASETFIPSSADIRDCHIQEVSNLSHVQCAMNAWWESIVALVYVDSTQTCHLCLSPHRVGNQSRQLLPEGHTVVIRGKTHVSGISTEALINYFKLLYAEMIKTLMYSGSGCI